MNERESLTGIVLDEEVTLALHEVCELCGIRESLVIEMVQEGVAEPLDPEARQLEFTGTAVSRLRLAYRLQRDLHVNLAGAALALELMDEIRALRSGRRR